MVVRRRAGDKGSPRRSVVGRRTVAGKATASAVTLDDRPLSVTLTAEDKRIIVALPYELWVLSTESLEVERTIELPLPHPTCFEGEDNALWIGGAHLFRGGLFATASTKVGSKLGGVVDHVCLVRPHLLCGVGTHGEILLDLDKEKAIHRRKVSEREVLGLVAAADGRAVFADGTEQVWVIDPDHASGYMKLKLKETSPVPVPAEGIVQISMTAGGSAILAARDGAVGWTNRALRVVDERLPKMDGPRRPLAVAGGERWVYVLRAGSVLQRFLVEQPPEDPDAKEQPEPLPEAQTCRLQRRATAMAACGDGRLVLAGPHADDHLGRLWIAEPDSLPWEALPLARGRTLVDEGEPAGRDAKKGPPSFERTRTKVAGEPLSTIKVDDVLAAKASTMWVTKPQGSVLERPHQRITAGDVMPGDPLVLPAMVRFHEGTARPALVVWPGVADKDRQIPELQWLAWGDDPRGWMPLYTPNIREQGWSRREVFPLQIALPGELPELPGRRAKIPNRWIDGELHGALGRECKKLLKVLW